MSENFDVEKVSDALEQSLKDDDDVYLDNYLEAYKEYNKFFQSLGSVFNFVSSDVITKIAVLEDFRYNDDNSELFASIKLMLDYEKSNEMFKNSRYVSGSRTLLRLHRGLEFILEFLMQLSKLSPSDKTSAVCQAAYNDTLAKHHPWVIRKAAVLAMYTLPVQQDLLNKVCTDVEKSITNLPKMLRLTKVVYDRTHNLYTQFDLHGLP
ncbi:ceramide-1-phosphate transfer protein [Condylostylus longicornis]|uniref:ceramide-1-phosphate transfer protein n=1 Tax=Condylostylus longicornis TaxID=2530218 RepID=UPI00244DD226|nr:ceramide-1-phosphate transfer protein [Condylostylus longicornis]